MEPSKSPEPQEGWPPALALFFLYKGSHTHLTSPFPWTDWLRDAGRHGRGSEAGPPHLKLSLECVPSTQSECSVRKAFQGQNQAWATLYMSPHRGWRDDHDAQCSSKHAEKGCGESMTSNKTLRTSVALSASFLTRKVTRDQVCCRHGH